MTQTTHNNFDLSIRFAPDGFYLSIRDNSRLVSSKKIYADFNNLTETQIIDLLAGQPELQIIFKSVRLIYENRHFTCVPFEFFSADTAYDYLKLQHPHTNKTETILYNRLEPWEAINVFSIPTHLNKVLNSFLPEISIEHHLSALLTDDIMMQNGKMIHIQIRNSETDYIVLHDSKLLLINTFEVSSAEDTVYHAINIATQLGFATDDCSITIHGNENLHTHHELLSKYFESCSTSELSL